MSNTEVELKFLVPQGARKAIVDEMARGSASLERRTLAAMYLDTADRRLARAGIAWRLRREGRRSPGPNSGDWRKPIHPDAECRISAPE